MQYDKNRFKIWAAPHPLILHWILNPILVINDLILGQRIAKVILIEKESDKPILERAYIPCPHCETLNDARLWTRGNALGHWFGYLCPNCALVIPCHWNLFSLAILALTFPLWYFPARFFRRSWLEKENERLAKILEQPLVQVKTIRWLFIGTVCWGGFMWLMVGVLPEIRNVLNGREWDLITMFVALPICLVGGLAWGMFMRFVMNRKV